MNSTTTIVALLLALFTASAVTYAHNPYEYGMALCIASMSVVAILVRTNEKVREFVSRFF